jgi:Mg/Co/Ni transporter MgtE
MIALSDQEDLAVFQALNAAEAAEVLDEVDATTESVLVRATPPDRLAALLTLLPADEGADVLGRCRWRRLIRSQLGSIRRRRAPFRPSWPTRPRQREA